MATHQAPPSLGFSRQEHWSRLPFPSPMHQSEKWKWSRSVMSDSSQSHGLQPTRLLHPWDFPGKSTGVGCHCLLQKSSYPSDKRGKIHSLQLPLYSYTGLDINSSFQTYSLLSPCVFNLYAEYIGEGNGTPLQYSCLENPTDGGAW